MKRIFLFIILLGVIFYLTSNYYFNNGLIINEYAIKSNRITKGFDGFKIVHFSDLLIDNKTNMENINKIIESINEQKPDVIVYTGDLFKRNITKEKQNKLTELLSKLECQYFKYAILGDHDNDTSNEILENSNFKILDNNYDLIYQNDVDPIMILGGDNIREIEIKDDAIYHIVLIHQPDYFKRVNDLDYEVFLAGHSLGGQIRIPLYGALIKKTGAMEYTNSYYQKNGSTMYVSYGIGNEKTNLRFLNKPSINIYRLYSK